VELDKLSYLELNVVKDSIKRMRKILPANKRWGETGTGRSVKEAKVKMCVCV